MRNPQSPAYCGNPKVPLTWTICRRANGSALRRTARVLRPGGRIGLAVWGSRRACGWASVFPIVDSKVQSEVCHLFFRLGEGDALLAACRRAGFAALQSTRIHTTLDYGDADEACAAAFEASPVALAWSRFGGATRQEVRRAYLDSLEPWRNGSSYSVPGEFVVVTGHRPNTSLVDHSPRVPEE